MMQGASAASYYGRYRETYPGTNGARLRRIRRDHAQISRRELTLRQHGAYLVVLGPGLGLVLGLELGLGLGSGLGLGLG